MTRLDLNVNISLIVSLLVIVVIAGQGFFSHAWFAREFRKAISDAPFMLYEAKQQGRNRYCFYAGTTSP